VRIGAQHLFAVAAILLGSSYQTAAQTYPTIVDACSVGPYVVRFKPNSADIDGSALSILTHIVENDTCLGHTAFLEIEGFIAHGEAGKLAIRRAESVRQRLVEIGLPMRRIHVKARGGEPALFSQGPNPGPKNAVVTVTWSPP
jgi:hypothetical protein